jgi:hypothetical protein
MFDRMTSGLTEFTTIVAALPMRVHTGFVCLLAVSAQRTQSICQVAMCLSQREARTKQKGFHLDRDALSRPTASTILKREENAMMLEYTQQ